MVPEPSPAWVFFPLRDITRAQPLLARLPTSRYVPSSGFRILSTVCSAHALASLFHPAATSRVLSVQGLLSPRSHPSSSEGACPLAVVSPSLCTLAPTFAEARAFPRAVSPGFEALIYARPRFTSPAIHLARNRSPLQFRLLQVLSTLDVSAVLPGAFRS